MPSNPYNVKPEGNLLAQGFKELRGVARDLKGKLHLTRYLGSFFVMSMAIQTIMLMATSFGIKEVQLTTAELIVATLLVQVVAIPGAFFVAWLSGKIGNVKALGRMHSGLVCRLRIRVLVCLLQRRVLRGCRGDWLHDGRHAKPQPVHVFQAAP